MNNYDEKSIKVLEGLNAVRKRPAMYIGSTDKRGLHHLVWEIVDNAIDEAINGFGDKIIITIHPDKSISIEDFGRGVPVGLHESGKSTPEVVYTVLHAGGKFEADNYKVSGGLHGVGASVVNALSKWMKVTIKKDKKTYEIAFKNGGSEVEQLKEIGTTNKTGTKVHFMPDEDIFSSINFSYTTIAERMQEAAFLTKGLTIELIDVEDEKHLVYQYEKGIEEYVDYLNEGKKTLHQTLIFNDTKDNIEVEIAMQYTTGYSENISSFVNNVKTTDGGSHEVGFKTALTRSFNDYAKTNNYIKGKDTTFEGKDVREGLTAVISLKIPENLLQFEGQTKNKLGTPVARSIVDNIVSEQLGFFFEENKKVTEEIISKALKSKQVREAAKKARDLARDGKNKSAKDRVLTGKLTPARSKNKTKNELFIVEGDSAGGSAKQGRDREHQAILPLRGKVLNTEKASLDDIYKNEELNTLIHAIGAGVGKEFDINDINYDKVIIMTDADDDGAHIQCLLLTFFYRYMRPLIENGNLYIAMPPLYLITEKDKKTYVYTDDDMRELTKDKKVTLQRYKGLGEMNAEQLRVTTMDPKSRSLIKVNITDSQLAEKRVSVLMGDVVEPRKEWINENVEFSLEDNFAI